MDRLMFVWLYRDATRVEASAPGFRRARRRLNRAFPIIGPRLLPVSSDPYLLIESIAPTTFFAIGRRTLELATLVKRLRFLGVLSKDRIELLTDK
jgi:hypothetical protein